MIDWIDRFEGRLVRIESWALVACVLLMLAFASYNVFYRNALIPLQESLRTSGPAAVESEEDDGGGPGEPSSESEGPSGFEGGFGDEDEEADEGSGFEGGFGAPEGDGDGSRRDGDSGDGRAGGGEAEPAGGPPPEGSLARRAIGWIDAAKIGWIDVFLRQLVLLVGFLGAMLAVPRSEHITIDAVGQFLEGRAQHVVDAATSLFATVVCVVLAASGWQLVELGLRYPRELFPWAPEWTFQAMFPVGFALIAVHFALRTLASGARGLSGETDSPDTDIADEADDEAPEPDEEGDGEEATG